MAMQLTVESILEKYEIVIYKQNEVWVASIDILRLKGIGDTRELAFAQLTKKTAEFIKDVVDADAESFLPPPKPRFSIKHLFTILSPGSTATPHPGENASAIMVGTPWWDIRGFLLRSAILIVVIGLAMSIAIKSISRQVSHRIDDLNGALSRVITRTDALRGSPWKAIDHKLEQWADPSNELSPEKQQQLIKELEIAVKRAKPFTDALSPLLTAPGASPSTAPAKCR